MATKRTSEPRRDRPSQTPGDDASETRRDDLAPPPELDRRRIGRHLVVLAAIVIGAVALITLLPGLASLRDRFAHGDPAWLAAGVVLKILSGLSYVAVFRSVFCRGMSWRLSTEIGLAELGANAVVPTGGAGGLALGAWALHRSGMSGERIARRSVAFFFLTSLPNVLGVIIIGLALALGAFEGHVSLLLSLLPAAVAAGAIVLVIAGGRWAGAWERRLAASRGEDSRAVRVLRALSQGVSESLQLLRQRDPWLLVGLAGYLAFDVMILWAAFHAFGSVPPLAILWMGYLIGELGGLIPVPGGIGGVDLGLVGTLVLYHVGVGAATAAVLTYRAIALVVPAVLGLVSFGFLRRTLDREASDLAGCEPGGEVDVIGRGTVRITA